MRSVQSLPHPLYRLGDLHANSSPNLSNPRLADIPDFAGPLTPRDLVRDTYLRHLSARTQNQTNPDRPLRPAAAAALDRCSLALEADIAALDLNAPLDPIATPIEQALDRAALLEFKNVINLRAELAEHIRLDQGAVLDVIRRDVPNAAQLPDHTLLALIPLALINRLRRALASVMFQLEQPATIGAHYPTTAELAEGLQRIHPVWASWQAATANSLKAPTADKIRGARQQEIQHNRDRVVELIQADPVTRVRTLDTLDACLEDALRFSLDQHAPIPQASEHPWAALKNELEAREQAARTGSSTLDDLGHAFRALDPRIKHCDAWLCALMLTPPIAARIEKSIASSRNSGMTQNFDATRDALMRLHSLGEATPIAAWFFEKREFARHLEADYPLAYAFLESLLLKLAQVGARHNSPTHDFLRHYQPALCKAIFQNKATEGPVDRANQLLDQLHATLRADHEHWKGTQGQLWLLAAPTQIARLIDSFQGLESAFAELGVKNMPAVTLRLVQAARSPANVRSEGIRYALDAYLAKTNIARNQFEQRVFAAKGKLAPATKAALSTLYHRQSAHTEAVTPTFQRFIELVRSHLPSSPARTSGNSSQTAGSEDAALNQAITQVEQERNSEPHYLSQARSADTVIDRFLSAMPARGSAEKRAHAIDRYLAKASVIDLISLGTTIPMLEHADELLRQGVTFKTRTGIERSYIAGVLPTLMSPTHTSPLHPSIQYLRDHFGTRVEPLVETFPNGREVSTYFSARATLSVSRLSDAVLSYKHKNSKTPITPDDLKIIARDAEQHYRRLNDMLGSVPQIAPLMVTSWGAMLDFLSDSVAHTERLGPLIDDSGLVAFRAAESVVNAMVENHADALDQAAQSPEVLVALANVARETSPEITDDANSSVASYCAHHLMLNMFVTLNRRAEANSRGGDTTLASQ